MIETAVVAFLAQGVVLMMLVSVRVITLVVLLLASRRRRYLVPRSDRAVPVRPAR